MIYPRESDERSLKIEIVVIVGASTIVGIIAYGRSSYEPPSKQYNPTRNQGLWFRSVVVGGIGGFIVGFILATVILNIVHARTH